MTAKRILYTGLFFFSLTYFTSCDKLFNERIDGNNTVITKERTISAFDEIVSTGNFDVYLTISDSTTLRIEAEENLIPFIVTKVTGEKLYVETKDDYRLDNNRAMKVFVTSPHMEGTRLTGSGVITCDSLTTDFLSIEISGSGRIEFNKLDVNDIHGEISGSGDITLSGSNDRSELEITGSGSIRSLKLLQNECEARITGSGNMYVNLEDYLKAVITGSGNIYYEGSPIINENVTGTGNVRRY